MEKLRDQSHSAVNRTHLEDNHDDRSTSSAHHELAPVSEMEEINVGS
jgi:hypothetical protein